MVKINYFLYVRIKIIENRDTATVEYTRCPAVRHLQCRTQINRVCNPAVVFNRN